MIKSVVTAMPALKMANPKWLRMITAILIACISPRSLHADEIVKGIQPPPAVIGSSLQAACHDCHSGATIEGGLNLEQLPWDLDSQENRRRWIRIHDRIRDGEMPPPDAGGLADGARKNLITSLGGSLLEADRINIEKHGRGSMRRLTQSEYEYTLRDLLHLPHLDIGDLLPKDRSTAGFTKVAQTLDMSRVQLAAYLDAAESSLRQAVASGVRPEPPTTWRAIGTDLFEELYTFGGREAMLYAKKGQWVPVSPQERKKFEESGQHDPELELAIFRSATWPYYGYPRGFLAKKDGEYRVRFSARAVRQLTGFRIVPAHRPLTMTFRARQPSGPDVSGDVRETGGWMDILPEPREYTTTIHLKAGETFEYSLLGLPVPDALNDDGGPMYFDFPPMPEGGHRGVAISSLEVTGPVTPTDWPPASHRVLFGDLPLQAASEDSSLKVELVSADPHADAEKLFRRFVNLAASRPVPESSIGVYLELIHARLKDGTPLAEAMLKGYQAFLCSGHFLYLNEQAAKDPDAQFLIASRLSHLFWNSQPDKSLLQNASEGKLQDKRIVASEALRLINDPRFERFVVNFTGEWLDLNNLRSNLPDTRLYPEYRKDDYLVDSMHHETLAFFTSMVRDNLPVTTLVDSDFTFVNDRLASHYDLLPVDGGAMRRVSLPATSPYGGLLTQASVLKVTANGTTTSPVVRGAWIMNKLMGDPPPPPPESVPAIEPDLRGATTIRGQLAKHTQARECAGCHARFDPVGFALENFDVMGAWRDRYRGLERGESVTGIDPTGRKFEYRIGPVIDASGTLLSGQKFGDIFELKSLLAQNPRQLAYNLLSQFTLYGTGAKIRFADRPEIEAILDRCEPDGFRVRDLLVELVQSSVFTGSSLSEEKSAVK